MMIGRCLNSSLSWTVMGMISSIAPATKAAQGLTYENPYGQALTQSADAGFRFGSCFGGGAQLYVVFR